MKTRHICAVWALVAVIAGQAAQTAAQCCGDCNGDGQVTIDELLTAVSRSLTARTDDGICGAALATCSCTQPNNYFSSTSDAGTPLYAWDVNFSNGSVNDLLKTYLYYVRAVRGGS